MLILKKVCDLVYGFQCKLLPHCLVISHCDLCMELCFSRKMPLLHRYGFCLSLYNYLYMVFVFGWPDPNTRECCES